MDEWTTHKLTEATLAVARPYIEEKHPTPLQEAHLLVATTRLLQDGSGGELQERHKG